MSFLSPNEAVLLANKLANNLKSKSTTKHPHIAVLGPKYGGLKNLKGETGRSSLVQKEDEAEVFSDVVEERTSQRIIPHVAGIRATLVRTRTEPEATITLLYSFFIRVSPPTLPEGKSIGDQFRAVQALVRVRNESKAEVTLRVSNSLGAVLKERSKEYDLKDGRLRVVIPSEEFQDFVEVLSTIREPFTLFRAFKGKQELTFTSYDYAYVAEFSLNLQFQLYEDDDAKREFKFLLINEGGWIASRSSLTDPFAFPPNARFNHLAYDGNNEAWSIGHLLEVEGELTELRGYEKESNWETRGKGTVGMSTMNCVYQRIDSRDVFRDYSIDLEKIPTVQTSKVKVKDFVYQVAEEFAVRKGISKTIAGTAAEAVSRALEKMGISSLYKFQEECVQTILRSVGENKAVAIRARTAGGKTLAFLIPIVISALLDKLNGGKPGVKSILFYPTKALCHDQADVVLELLWNCNVYLKEHGVDKVLSLGILHGNTYSESRVNELMNNSGRPKLEGELRYKCPLRDCKSRLVITFTRETIPEGGRGDVVVRGRVKCSGRDNPSCVLSGQGASQEPREAIELLNRMLRPTRGAVYFDPPDILATVPDMLSYRLFRDPNQHAIFGRTMLRCDRCWRTTIHLTKRTCDFCRQRLSQPQEFTYPQIIVFDEAHQLRGSFGSQVSYVVSRLKKAVSEINNLSSYSPLFVFSSATFNQADKFVQKFLEERVGVEVVNAEYVKQNSDQSTGQPQSLRAYLFLMPKGYTPDSTLIRILQNVFAEFVRSKHRYPVVLIFANQLSTTSELINEANSGLHDFLEREGLLLAKPPVVSGHSTDWDEDRADVEDRFSKGEIDVLVATRGLEVGVDFDRIDILILFGAPFYLSDFLQRVGRAARKRSALVISVHQEKPIDFFFLRNYKLISDISVRDKALESETPSFTRGNPVIYERTVARALLDYLATRPNAFEYYSQRIKGGGAEPLRNLETLLCYLFDKTTARRFLEYYRDSSVAPPTRATATVNDDLVMYIKEAVGNRDGLLDVVKDAIFSLLDALESESEASLGDLIRNPVFEKRFFLLELRSADYSVTVKYEDLFKMWSRSSGIHNETEYIRPRSLGLAVGHYATNQISSYRKHSFVVTRVEGRSGEAEEIDKLLWR